MKFFEVIQPLMAGGSNAIRRPWMTEGSFIRYSEYLNAFVFHHANGIVRQLADLGLCPGDLFADDWEVVILDPRTGKVAQ